MQKTIADLSARLVNAASDEVDAVIDDSLQLIAERLQADRAMLWRGTHDDTDGKASYYWVHPAAISFPDPLPLLVTLPFLLSKLELHEPAAFSGHDEVPDAIDRDALMQHGLQAAVVIPMLAPDDARRLPGVLAFGSSADREWPRASIESLRILAALFAQALARRSGSQALLRTRTELAQLRDRLNDGEHSRPAVSTLRASRLIVAESASVRQALAQVSQVAPSSATVLLLGETGAGKEVFAQAIHDLSPRHHKQIVRVSCGAIPSALIESELFGRERGAYTGALTRQIGRFEAASQSTLFLDEIGELSAEVQVKLLRVLQERVIERLGSSQTIKVDVRIIAATNRNLEKAVEDKSFREDLFYRLNVFPIVVPPLRDRIEDIPGMAWEFVDEFSKAMGKNIESISQESMRQLQLYPWPGNVRELRNVIERAVILSTGPRLTVPVPQRTPSRQPAGSMTLRSLETEHIRAVLDGTHWRIRGHGGAAERLGLKPTTLEGRMAKLGLVRPRQA